MSSIQERAEKLASKPYSTVVIRQKTTDADYVYVASHPELPGCAAQGETPLEAKTNLAEVRLMYFEHLLEHNLPLPVSDESEKTEKQPINLLRILSGGVVAVEPETLLEEDFASTKAT